MIFFLIFEKWNTFRHKNAKVEKFHNFYSIYVILIKCYVMVDIQKEVKSFFQDNVS